MINITLGDTHPVRSPVYFDILPIYRSDRSIKEIWCITQLSQQSSHGPNDRTSVDTLTLSEEPLSNASHSSLVTDYY